MARSDVMGSSRARAGWKGAALRVAIGASAGFLLIELAVRVYTHSLFLVGVQSDRYVTKDPLVGRIPRAGVSIVHPKGFRMNIGDHGVRSNGNTPARAERPLTLVVGNSFAFSDGVDDEDSWPAVLERLSGRRVVNAGVPGFGFDQAVLRAEQLADVYAPDVIIVSFIPHDVLRCEMSYWSGHPKPYFDIDGPGLRLHPASAPARPLYAPLQQLLSLSVTLDTLFPRLLHWEGPEVTVVHKQGREVACRLMERLAALKRTRIVVLAQPQQPTATPEQQELKNGLLACAKAKHLLALDLFPVVEPLPPEQRTRLFRGHMSVEGNRLVATEVASFLEHNLWSRDGGSVAIGDQ